jgi:AcrR family transcriptional regulator
MLDDEQPSSPYRTGEVMVAQIRTPHSTWIDAGLRALAAGGPDAVRVDLLAKALGVTRGGFYHHFAGRQVFLDALLDAWEQRCTDDVLARVEEEGGDARAKVRRAGMLTFSRLDYLRALIGTFSDDPDEVEAQGMLAFSLAIGSHFIAADHDGRSRQEVLERATQRLLA